MKKLMSVLLALCLLAAPVAALAEADVVALPVEAPVEEVAEVLAEEAPVEEIEAEAADAAAPMDFIPTEDIFQIPMYELTANASLTQNIQDAFQITLGDKAAKSYKTSAKKVATVSGTGLVTPVAEGKAKITVTLTNKKKLTLTLTVVDPFKPTGVVLDQTGTVTVNLGQPLQLYAFLVPETAQSGLTWKSSSAKIATVSNGLVTGVKEGTATITVTTRNSKKATVKVKVVDPFKATAVWLDAAGTVELPLNQTLKLNAFMAPEGANSKLTWSTSSKKIAKVGADGLVTPVKKGTATITVKTSTKKQASVKVKVVDAAVPPTGLLGEWPASDLDNVVEMGDEYGTVVDLLPSNARGEVYWFSSNPDVARIKSARWSGSGSNEVTIEPVFPGKTVITAMTDNGLSASFTLTVITRILPEAIAFNAVGPLNLFAGQQAAVEYAVYPSESIGREENCATIVSTNPAVATVTGKGDNGLMDCSGDMDYWLHITAKAPGTTTIIVSLRNGVWGAIDVNVF